MEGGTRAKLGTHTKEALCQKASAKAEHERQLELAIALVAGGEVGLHAAASFVRRALLLETGPPSTGHGAAHGTRARLPRDASLAGAMHYIPPCFSPCVAPCARSELPVRATAARSLRLLAAGARLLFAPGDLVDFLIFFHIFGEKEGARRPVRRACACLL